MNRIFTKTFTTAAVAMTLASCDSGEEQFLQIGQTATTIETPAFIRQIAAVNPSALALHVTVNGDTEIFTGQGSTNPWQVTVNAPSDVNSEITVGWYQTVEGEELRLAEQTTSVFVPASPHFEPLSPDYTTEGPDFDFDGDGASNLAELSAGRNPLDTVDTVVRRSNAFFLQPNLPIDTLIIGDTSNTDGNAVTQFSIWHNGAELRLRVCVNDDEPTQDSPDSPHHDDSIEVFIDTDNSKGSAYDNNDHQLTFVPGLLSPLSSSSLPLNSMIVDWEFSNQECGYELIAQIPLESLGIAPGQTIGFDVEVNDDDNGGERDAKYTWIGAAGVDNSFLDPSSFGTVRLAP